MNPADDQPKLDPQINAKIKELVDKDVSALTPDDKIFLRARKDYLGRQARRKLGSALDEQAVEKAPEEPQDEKKQENSFPPANPSTNDNDEE